MGEHPISRRKLLAGGTAAGLLLLPSPWAWVWARSEGAARLLRVPKLAIVIGNSAYRHAPALRNAGNDARAMGAALIDCGFEATLMLDATRAEMLESFGAFARRLASRQAVGFFYFAGHGVQLAWRNYLLPVDAEVAGAADIATRCVDVGELMSALRGAANPMNVVVLDACRDNPFGRDLRTGQSGLSQMDAPPATLLAYATAPGNTADDGEGDNGLYTGNLVREIRVKETRIEDVFKRVRLSVRRQSRGAQIPWESTSLEEDFYFLPPARLVDASEAETRRAFEAELAIWESIKATNDPRSLEDYLRRYPGGRFTELAQLRLDTVLARLGEKRIEIAPSPGNPNTAGTVRADTGFRVGDSYTYRVSDLYTGIETSRVTDTVTAVGENEVVFDEGRRVTDLLGNILKNRDGQLSTGSQFLGVEYAIGKRWTSHARVTSVSGNVAFVEMDIRVQARETITVPAGTFDCFRVRGTGYFTTGDINTRLEATRWVSPGRVRFPVAYEGLRTTKEGRVLLSVREELVAFRQS